MNDVTVVVVLHDSGDLVDGFLDALGPALDGVAQSQLIAVDNGSMDQGASHVTTRVPDAVLVHQKNLGYAAAINAAVAAAAPSDAVLISNPDVRLGPGCVAALLGALAEPGVGIAVPRLLTADGALAWSLRREPTVLRALGEAVLGGRRAGRFAALGETVRDPVVYEQAVRADWASGAVMAVSRHCLEAVGPWDERFFLYSEETDFDLRARDAGFALRHVPTAIAAHLGGDVHRSPRLWGLLAVNRVRLFAQRHGRAHTAAFWAAVTVNEAARALRRHHRAALLALLRPSRWAT